jgi:hypothetical protein
LKHYYDYYYCYDCGISCTFFWYTFFTFCRADGIPQVSVFGSLLLNIFINDLCDVINHSNGFLFADIKIYRAVSSPSECLLLRSDIDCAHERCSTNFMKPNFSEIRVTCFTRETDVLNYQYRLGNSFILRTDCTKHLNMHIDGKVHSHRHHGLYFQYELKLLVYWCYILLLDRSKLECASFAWKTVTITDSNKHERIITKLCSPFPQQICPRYGISLS